MGHSYICYAPLLHGCTTVMFEGKPVGTPDAGTFWRVIAEHGVSAMFTAPTAFRAIKKEDPKGELIRKYDLSKFRTLLLAGERADPPTIQWAEEVLKVPVLDHWWQTETGWCIAGNPVGLGALPVRYGSACVPMPGYAIDIVDEASKVQPANKIGSIVVKLPLPPGNFPTLWHQDDTPPVNNIHSRIVSYPAGPVGTDAVVNGGDGGQTSLGDGSRVSKQIVRIRASWSEPIAAIVARSAPSLSILSRSIAGSRSSTSPSTSAIARHSTSIRSVPATPIPP